MPLSRFDHKPDRCPFGHFLWSDGARKSDPVGLLYGGQLEFLLGAEVRVQAALAHPGRRVQSKG
jgi:hypothetical protein